MNVLENHPLDKLNTFGINVRSKYLVEVSSIDEILEIIESEKFKNLKKLVLSAKYPLLLITKITLIFSNLVLF